jgi:hypothetical protein
MAAYEVVGLVEAKYLYSHIQFAAECGVFLPKLRRGKEYDLGHFYEL